MVIIVVVCWGVTWTENGSLQTNSSTQLFTMLSSWSGLHTGSAVSSYTAICMDTHAKGMFSSMGVPIKITSKREESRTLSWESYHCFAAIQVQTSHFLAVPSVLRRIRNQRGVSLSSVSSTSWTLSHLSAPSTESKPVQTAKTHNNSQYKTCTRLVAL